MAWRGIFVYCHYYQKLRQRFAKRRSNQKPSQTQHTKPTGRKHRNGGSTNPVESFILTNKLEYKLQHWTSWLSAVDSFLSACYLFFASVVLPGNFNSFVSILIEITFNSSSIWIRLISVESLYANASTFTGRNIWEETFCQRPNITLLVCSSSAITCRRYFAHNLATREKYMWIVSWIPCRQISASVLHSWRNLLLHFL